MLADFLDSVRERRMLVALKRQEAKIREQFYGFVEILIIFGFNPDFDPLPSGFLLARKCGQPLGLRCHRFLFAAQLFTLLRRGKLTLSSLTMGFCRLTELACGATSKLDLRRSRIILLLLRRLEFAEHLRPDAKIF